MVIDLSDFEQKLRSRSRGEVPSAVVAKLKYLWSVAHEVAKTSPQLSHAASLEFKDLITKEDVVLPRHITEKLCSGCGAIQIPSVTCSTRLRTSGRRSCVNRALKSLYVPDTQGGGTVKVKNVAVTRCLLCQHKAPLPKIVPASVAGLNKDGLEEDRTTKNVHSYLGCKRNAIKRRRHTEVVEGAGGGTGATPPSQRARTAGQYSGLKKQSPVADTKCEASAFSFLKSGGGGGGGRGVGTLLSPHLSRNNSSASLSSVGGFVKSASSSGAGAGAGGVSLLDLERSKKKEKKLARKMGK